VVGIACEQFRQKNQRWPNELAERIPTYISAIPLDPFDGQPLRFAKLNDGVVVYSVGKRLPPELGASPASRPEFPQGVEVGFRLWNTDQRGILAPAEHIPPDNEPPP